ncbi:MAG: hypothetical protein Q4C04_08080, partial [Clostridia bacterium]|nr:hypothetical protein [Clostridia bacterium]
TQQPPFSLSLNRGCLTGWGRPKGRPFIVEQMRTAAVRIRRDKREAPRRLGRTFLDVAFACECIWMVLS